MTEDYDKGHRTLVGEAVPLPTEEKAEALFWGIGSRYLAQGIDGVGPTTDLFLEYFKVIGADDAEMRSLFDTLVERACDIDVDRAPTRQRRGETSSRTSASSSSSGPKTAAWRRRPSGLSG
jgi:hypothetical protein